MTGNKIEPNPTIQAEVEKHIKLTAAKKDYQKKKRAGRAESFRNMISTNYYKRG